MFFPWKFMQQLSIGFSYFLSTLPSFFFRYFCVKNYALSETVGFTVNVQVAISLIVFVGWNRHCLQAVKLGSAVENQSETHTSAHI